MKAGSKKCKKCKTFALCYNSCEKCKMSMCVPCDNTSEDLLWIETELEIDKYLCRKCKKDYDSNCAAISEMDAIEKAELREEKK